MAKNKKKMTAAQKAEKKRRRELYMFVFMNGKQVRVKRPPQIDGMSVDDFIRRNADDLWYHQSEMWEMITPDIEGASSDEKADGKSLSSDGGECPF